MSTKDASQAEPAEVILDPVADNPAPEIVADAPSIVPAEKPEEIVDAPPPRSTRDERMQAIAERIKAKREAEAAPEFTGDYSDPAQSVGTVGIRHEDAPAAPADGPEPRRLKLKIRQEEREYTEDEVIALAQKAAASDSYFEDGKSYFEKAKELYDAATRTAPSRPHQDDQPQAQPTADLAAEPAASDPHQDDDAQQVIHDIQFGDEEEAARKLRSLIDSRVSAKTQSSLVENKMRNDLTNTMETFREFQGENPDLASDPHAEKIMETMIYEGYREDLKSIGVPDDRIPANGDELANWHRFYRVEGRPVRNTKALLTDVKSKYLEWRGAPKPAAVQTATEPGRPGVPRVALARDERRASIPSQPTRATASPQTAPSATSGQPNRSAKVQQMMAERNRRVTAS